MNDGIEMVMQAISVVESLVSHLKIHFGPYRNADKITKSDELQVSVNGPPFNYCDSIVKLVLDQ